MLPAVHLVVSGLVGVVVVIMQLSIHRIDEGHEVCPPVFTYTHKLSNRRNLAHQKLRVPWRRA
jgi:hypothetical protein